METRRRYSLLRTSGLLLLFVTLLVLPTLLRTAYYYRRIPAIRKISQPDHRDVDMPTVALVTFADADVERREGQVLIDRAHDNTVTDADLNVLLARLTARGMETVSLTPSDDLPDMLRDASALVVVAPHEPFYPWELEALTRFVEQGGRVLLVADPSRYTFRYEYDDDYGFEYSVPTSDVSAINSLASRFGLAFADDYIYNTTENAGNYQYIILRNFAHSPLTAGLDEVIFYAAHSIAAGEVTLITTDEGTTSSLSEQTGGLATMSLGGGGRVLAVSDFTFMTEPYNTSADNKRLTANLADFLAGAERTYGLTGFPHFFGDTIDLVPLMGLGEDDALPVEAIEQGHILQSALEAADKTLHWQNKSKDGRDTIFFGVYEGVDFTAKAGKILTNHGISFTLETIERDRATPTLTPRYTPTPPETLVPSGAVTHTVQLDETFHSIALLYNTTVDEILALNGITDPASIEAGQVLIVFLETTPTPTERPPRDWIAVPGIGRVDAKEIALIFQNEEAGRQVVMVLAFAEEGLNVAVQRLILNDFSGCLLDQDLNGDPAVISLALCPTAYEPSEEGPWPTPTPIPTPTPFEDDYPTPTPTPTAGGGFLIVADDDGPGMYEWWTGAYDFENIVYDAGYEATVWSTGWDGEVTLEQMQSYDAVIWCTGDYQEKDVTPSEEDLLNIAAYLADGGRLILSGAFIGSTEESESGLLLDIQVTQADHPLAAGFEAGQVIALERFTSDEDYSPFLIDASDTDTIIFARGPNSEFAAEAVVATDEDEYTGSRTVLIGFPIFLMPWEERYQFGGNAILWLTEGVKG